MTDPNTDTPALRRLTCVGGGIPANSACEAEDTLDPVGKGDDEWRYHRSSMYSGESG